MARSKSKKPPAEAPREVELTLEAPRDVIEALAQGPALDSLGARRARLQRLRNLYFDTEDRVLDGEALALRVRQVGTRFVQSVKRRREPVAGLFVREESEAQLPGPDPDPALIADPALAARVRALCGERPLVPIVETEFTRVARSLSFEGARIEAAFDVGETRASVGSFPISQLELELKAGDPRALYRLAIGLREQHPELRPALRDKTGAALAALRGGGPSVARAQPLDLPRGATLDALLGAALAECLRSVTANVAAALEGAGPEGVHQMRVGVRRLRSGLRLLRNELPAGRAEWLRDALDPLTNALGGVRDCDVFLARLADCEQSHEIKLGALRDRCLEERSVAHAALRELLAAPETAQLFLELGLLAFGAEWRAAGGPQLARPARDCARELAARFDRRAQRAGRGFSSLPPLASHQLRIRVKNARYAVELLAPLLPAKRSRRYAQRAKGLQELLGIANDAAAARERIASLDGSCDPRSLGFVAGWTAREAAHARSELPRAWRRWKRVRRPWE